MYLQQFDYEFVYKSGSSHINADTLSKMPGDKIAQINVIGEIFSGVDIRTKQQEDPNITNTIRVLQEGGKVSHSFQHQKKWLVICDGVLFRRVQLSSMGPSVDQLVLPDLL